MQKVSTPKRYYIDHSANDKVEVRAVACPWPQKRTDISREIRPTTSQTERLFSAGRLVRGGFLRKR